MSGWMSECSIIRVILCRFDRNSTNVTAPSNPNAIMRTNEPNRRRKKTDDAKLAPIKCVWSAVSDSIYLNGRESSSFSASHSLDAALFFISCFTRNSAVWSRSRSALSSAIWFICECARQFFSDVFFCFCFFLSFLLLLFIRWMCVSPATPVVAFTILELFIRFRIQIERIIWIERERCVFERWLCRCVVKLALVLARCRALDSVPNICC